MDLAPKVIERLRMGNQRYLLQHSSLGKNNSAEVRKRLINEQEPFAIILACSDSRVPVEVIFDQEAGNLFVIRVAGNVAAPAVIGSIEYAVNELACNFLLVMGHTACGAVAATLKEHFAPSIKPSTNLSSILNLIQPALETLLAKDEHIESSELLAISVRANIINTIQQIKRDSLIIRDAVKDEKLCIVGAEYSLENGKVEFLDSTI
jgi:carbonic anhydrase